MTATRTCKNGNHPETETVSTDYTVVTPAQCGAAGTGKYTTQAFNNSAFTEQTKEVEITALAHDWNEPTYVWSADNSTVTATRTCKNGDHPETETVGTDYAVVTPAACGVAGTGKYTTQVFSNGAFTEQTKEVEITALTHVWSTPSYTWGANNATCTAERHCTRDGCTAAETEEATVTFEETLAPKCGVAGETTYTATFTNEAFEDQTAIVPIAALEHNWSVAFTWTAKAEGGYTVSAVRTCSLGDHPETADRVEVSSEITVPATSDHAGEIKYTATAYFGDETAVDTKTDAIEQLNPDYVFVRFDWNAGNTAADVVVLDQNNGNAEVRFAAAMSEDAHTATCTANAYTVYTATYGEHSDSKTVTVEDSKLPHSYAFDSFIWAADNTSADVKLVCANCPAETTVEASMSEDAHTATCTADAYTVYTATYGEHSDSKTVTVENSKLPHSYAFDSFIWAADNTSADVKLVCANCPAETTAEATMSEDAHTATCTADAYTVYTATYGEHSDSKTVTVAGTAGHTPAAAVTEHETPATCTTAGSYETVVYCTACGEEISRETHTVPAKGHTWGAWETVTPATEDETGLEKRVCTACGEEETRVLPALGEIVTKTVRFINIARMHYEIGDEGGEPFYVYDSSAVTWTSGRPLRFKAVCYSNFAYDEIVIYANGTELTPDEEGWYTLPKNSEFVTVTAVGAMTDESAPKGRLTFWEMLLRLIRRIISFFTSIGR